MRRCAVCLRRRQPTHSPGKGCRLALALRRQDLCRLGRPSRKLPPGNGFTIEDGCIKSLPHPNIDEDLFTKDLSRFRTGVRLEDLAWRQQRREVPHTGSRHAGRRRAWAEIREPGERVDEEPAQGPPGQGPGVRHRVRIPGARQREESRCAARHQPSGGRALRHAVAAQRRDQTGRRVQSFAAGGERAMRWSTG